MKKNKLIKDVMMLSVLSVALTGVTQLNQHALQSQEQEQNTIVSTKPVVVVTDNKKAPIKPESPKAEVKPVIPAKPKVHYIKVSLTHNLQDLIKELSKTFNIEEALIYGTIDLESDFQPTCESHTGAKGLMQVSDSTFEWMLRDMKTNHPEWYKRVEGKTAWDNATNLIMGVYHLRYLKDRCPEGIDDEEVYHYMLTAYNRGVGGAHSFGKKHGTYSSVYSREVIKRTYKYEDLLK